VVEVKSTRLGTTMITWTKRGAKYAGSVDVRETAAKHDCRLNVGRR
jgi:hypothetical protein